MGRLVQKFGGTSVRDAEHIRHVAKIIAKSASEGHQIVTVVSAMGHTTDSLIALADQVTDDASAREMDMLLSTGEQMSAALVAMAVQSLGIRARSFTGAQAGILTDSTYGAASIKEVRTQAIEQCLADGQVAVVAGFQGISDGGEIFTLGRGGSDTTAVGIAAALRSQSCDIYSDVNGVYTADPRILSGARRLSAISYEEMLEMAAAGAQVLNARSVQLAMNMQVAIRLRSTFEPDDLGTLITHKFKAPDYVVCGIACDTNRVAINLRVSRRCWRGDNDVPVHYLDGVSKLFKHLHQAGIPTDMVTLLGRDDETAPELIFTVDKRAARRVEQAVAELAEELGNPHVRIDSDIARISVVGSGLNCGQGVVAAIFDTLCSAAIPVHMLTTGDIRVTALVPSRYKDAAIERIHDRFCMYPPVESRLIPESRIA